MSDGIAFGLSLPNQHPRELDPVRGLEEQLELLALVEDLGWDSVWAGQHFLIGDLQMTQPIPYLARLAGASTRVRLGLGIALLALANPVQLAEELATVDVVSGGRLIAGVGLGYRTEEYAAFGVPERQRVRRLTENLAAMERLWTGEPVRIDLPWCQVDGATISVLPVQRPRPPVWMAAHTDAAVERAARLADAWFVSPHVNVETAQRQLELFRTTREAAGLAPAATIPASKEVFCAETREDAVRLGGPYITGKYRSYAKWGQDKILPEEVDFTASFAELAEGRWVVGTPQDCIDQLLPFVAELGIDHLVCRMTWPGMPVDVAARSIELFTREVVPALRAGVGAAR